MYCIVIDIVYILKRQERRFPLTLRRPPQIEEWQARWAWSRKICDAATHLAAPCKPDRGCACVQTVAKD